MARIGLSFNLWKGEEFIPSAIEQIGNYVDYIVIVYQQESNFGDIREDLTPTLKEWVKDGLIDEYVDYKPQFNDVDPKYFGIHNELSKRNIAIKKALENKCDYLIDCDSDEIYEGDKFKECIDEVISGGYDSAFCKMLTYYKNASCVLDEIENYYVPMIYKINEGSKFEPIENENFPVLVDGKRRVKTKMPLVFNEDEILMHHFSYVRKDSREMIDKFINASSRLNFSDERVVELVKCWDSFKIGDVAKFGADQEFKTRITKNIFNL